MDCQLKAKFRYEDKLPTQQGAKQTFGVIIHHCLDVMIHDGDVEQACKLFEHYWFNPEELEEGLTVEQWGRGQSFGGLLNRGIDILRTAHELRQWDDMEVIGTEIKFLVPIGRHELTGYVDLLELRRSGNGKLLLRVCDYKTSSYKPSQAKLRHNIQFTIYDYATHRPEFWLGNGDEFPGIPDGERLMHELVDVPRRCIWVHLWNYTELDAGERTQADYDRCYLALTQVEMAQQLGLYIPDISGDTCSICDYTKQCGITIPTREDLLAEENAWV